MQRGTGPGCGYSPTVQSAEVERTVETLKMEVEQIMKVGAGARQHCLLRLHRCTFAHTYQGGGYLLKGGVGV